jgi:tetratricopeptide (TPR) repeat protein
MTIKGGDYPGKGAFVYVCDNAKGAIGMTTGVADKYYATASYLYRGDQEPTSLSPTRLSPFAAGQPFELRVTVGEKDVNCSHRGKQFVSCGKEKDDWGSLAFDVGGGFEEVVLAGKAEPSWIQGLVDKARQDLLAEFAKRWQPKDDLPAWLFEKGPVVVQEDPLARGLPADLDEQGATLVERALKVHATGEAALALRLLDGAEIPDVVRDYLGGLFLHDLGRDEEAAALCRKVREKDPDFVPSVLIEVRALAALGRDDEALALYREVLAKHPRAGDLHADAALFMGGRGRWDEANRVVGTALSSGLRSERLDATSRMVHKALNGPAWPRGHDYSSQHYLVSSDLDPKVCFEASQILEQAYAVFSSRLERAAATTERFKVFLFSGQAGYQDHILDLLGETVPHSAGLYVPSLRQLFIWNLPEREDMMKTVRHEGFHQYLHRIMDDPPLWFNEGLAEYFEEAKVIQGKWTTGAPRHDHLELLKPPQPLEKFLFLDRRAFMANAGPNYAQGWAFMHFLLHSSRENRQLFDRFWDSFKRIPSHAEAIRAALGDRTVASLEPEFRVHVDVLAKTR